MHFIGSQGSNLIATSYDEKWLTNRLETINVVRYCTNHLLEKNCLRNKELANY